MSHKTMIDGVAYEISGGKTLIGGTAYSIDKGKTLVGGTAYEVGFDDGMRTVKCYPSISIDTDYLYIYIYYKPNEVTFISLTESTKELPIGTIIYFQFSVYDGASGSLYMNGQFVKSANSNADNFYEYTINKDITIEIVGTNNGGANINIIEQ